VAEAPAASPEQAAFRSRLLDAGILLATGVPGVYGRSAVFESIRTGFDALVTAAAAADRAEHVRFPPIIPRAHLEATGYLKSFPHLAGTVFSFEGSEQDALEQESVAARGGDWSRWQQMTDLVLVPAACYPVYPAVAARGPVPEDGLTVDAGASLVFRHEPSGDPARLQMFHQREMVRIGTPEAVVELRNRWRSRAVDLLTQVGLEPSIDIATDPFFGRSGRMLAANQRAQELKFEVQLAMAGPDPTAVASFNYHQEHFAHIFGITVDGGGPVHTACLGFGLERITLGLLHRHGLDVQAWPSAVRDALWS
jgi:seryl-tRNA synthetase